MGSPRTSLGQQRHHMRRSAACCLTSKVNSSIIWYATEAIPRPLCFVLQGLKARLRAAAPDSIINESFVGPKDLAEIAAATRINVHPCLYDAYGMTIVECASQVLYPV